MIRFTGSHPGWIIAKVMAIPGLMLQGLTTRQPDDAQIEVAITAMESAIAADKGQEFVAWFPARAPEEAAAEPAETTAE